MEENPENSGDRPIITQIKMCRTYGGEDEVLVVIYDKDIKYQIARYKMNLIDYNKLEGKLWEEKQCEICLRKVENKIDLCITADKHVKCIKCTNPSYTASTIQGVH